MGIFKDVAKLLHSNDCVIVPNFGAFVLKSKSAYIEKNEFFMGLRADASLGRKYE